MEPQKTLLEEFLDGGWLIPALGAASMFTRLLVMREASTIVQQATKIFVAALSCTIVWFILEQTDLGSLYKAIIYGITGVISPEIIAGIVLLAKRFSKNPIDTINDIRGIDHHEEKKLDNK